MKRLLYALVASVLISSSASAALVTYNFAGAVSYLDDPHNYFGYQVGQSLPISFTVDISAPDRDPSPHHGEYGNNGSGFPRPLASLTIGTYTIAGAEWQWFDIYDNWVDESGNVWDQLSAYATSVKGPTISVQFGSKNLDAIQSDALGGPIDPLLFDQFASAGMNLRVGFPPYLDVDIERLAASVPEPGAVAIFGAAIVGLMMMTSVRRRRLTGVRAD